MALFLAFLLVTPLPALVSRADDPAPGIWQTRSDARGLECRTLDQETAHGLYPARVPDLAARRRSDPSSVLVCTRRILGDQERPPRDEAILSDLTRTVEALTQAAALRVPKGITWEVDAFYPSPQVGAKIAVAARTELVEHGHSVSDRVPVLAPGDLSVIHALPAEQAYPLACARYFAEHALTDQEAFLGLMILDPRETQLHAGICTQGQWRWIQ